MSKICTDIEQSKKLVEILPIESADLCYYYKDDIPQLVPFAKHNNRFYIPCWSLAALLDILQNAARSIDEDGSVTLDSYKTVEWHLGINNSDLEFVTESNPVDAAFEMIVKLKENNLL